MKFGQYSTFAFVDVETTGTSASQDRVLEVGILRVENGVIVGQMNSLLDPDIPVPPEITHITGITDEDILDAPHFSDIVDEIQELLNGAIFVAHNARFDYAFLKHEFKRLGLSFNYKTLDTVKLSRKLYPALPRHNLDAIIQLLQITVENRHRAYDDARVLFDFLLHVEKTFEINMRDAIIHDFLKSPSLPQQLDKKQIQLLPEGPGVYFMYDKMGTLLYVGKSVDIKARVLSHFYNDFDSANDLLLAREVASVEAKKTSGDLGASLLESETIKKLFPIHNKMLRQKKGMLAFVQKEIDGYLTGQMLSIEQVDSLQHHDILCAFASKKQLTVKLLEIAKEYKLCLKLLGLEKGKGACFGTQIGLCNGACIKAEETFKYNVRFVEAFTHTRVPQWPFPGPIGIHEHFEEDEEIHVIYNWCYLGSIKEATDEALSEILKKEVSFDWDTYKILYRFIKKHVKLNSIIHLHELAHSSPTEPQ